MTPVTPVTTQQIIETQRQRPPARSLIIGLIVVLAVVGGVFVVRSIPRWQWEQQCAAAGGQVLSHATGSAPYLAHGSVISYTCEGPSGPISTWG